MTDFVTANKNSDIATLALNRGKVNALNGQVIEKMRSALARFENDPAIKAIILTGQGKFFSFGFDIPEFLSYSKLEFTDYLTRFTDLYTYLFLYPKPIIAALNGHTIAGGCMLALACDKRVMVSGKAKIALNEISFGSSVFAGSTEMLRFCVGGKNAAEILYSGAMYTAEEAKVLGLIDEVTAEKNLIREATKAASALSAKPGSAFASIKSLLRKSVAQEMRLKEKGSINEFVEIWYSDATWENLKNIKIH